MVRRSLGVALWMIVGLLACFLGALSALGGTGAGRGLLARVTESALTQRLQAGHAEAGETALEIQGGGPNGRQRIRRFEHLDARLAALQVSSPGARGIGIDVTRLAVESSDPALRLVDLAGRLRVVGDSLEVDLSRGRFRRSQLRTARGRLSWPHDTLLFDLSLHADSATLSDFHFIDRRFAPGAVLAGGVRLRSHGGA